MHYFIKCPQCGHLNDLQTEYQVFCSSCNKKLPNNFPDWKKRNPGKSFDDFRQLVCISDQETSGALQTKKKKHPKSLKYWIGFVIVFALAYAFGTIGGEYLVNLFKSGKTAEAVLTQEWVRETYGVYGLSLETPVKMTRKELELPPQAQQLIDQLESYSYETLKGFSVLINTLKYKDAVGEINLENAARGSISELKMQEGVSDLKFTQEAYANNGIPGFIQKGSFIKNGTRVEFINTAFGKGLLMWQVMVIYDAKDKVGRIAAKRVIKSIAINKDITMNIPCHVNDLSLINRKRA